MLEKWFLKKDSPCVDATPDYKHVEKVMKNKTVKELYEEWLDGYIAGGGEVRTHNWQYNDPNRNTRFDPYGNWFAGAFDHKHFYVVKEDGALPVDGSEGIHYIVLPGVHVYIPAKCKSRIYYMEDFSFEGPYIPDVFTDYLSYEMILERLITESEVKEEERQKTTREAQEKLDAEAALEKKQFDTFLKKTQGTRDLGVQTAKDFNWAGGRRTYFCDKGLQIACPKAITISHLPKKTTICSGDKNYSMTIYVTPQAYLKIEKDTGTGTIITVSDEVAAALVGDKK